MKNDNVTIEKVLAVSILMAQNTATLNSRRLLTLRLTEKPDTDTLIGIIFKTQTIFKNFLNNLKFKNMKKVIFL